MKNQKTLFVTGASGHLGRRAVEFLLGARAGHVIAGSREPGKLADLAAKGAQTRAIDFEKPETLANAFAGVDRLLIVSTDAIDRPGRRIAQHRAAIAAAVAAGVKHIVYTSYANAVPGSAVLLNPDHQQTEEALAATPIGYTILRNNAYAENLLASLPHALTTGQWFTAGRNGRAGFVTRDDCARTAGAALAADFDGRRVLDVTGPELLSHADIARLVSEITGRRLEHVSVDEAALVAGMTQAGLPEPVARIYASFDTALANGETAIKTNVVATLTGREPVTLREFLAERLPLLAA
jgi:NAD(P)H dehydrogenase (quinone)